MPFISHKLGKTYYKVSNKNKKNTPLVFLHGGPGSGMQGNLPLLKLIKNRPVYLYDQLGCGKSSITNKNKWNIDTFVTELDILIKKWGLDNFHLGGGSWGTTLALEYYLYNKNKNIKSLIFRSPMFSAKDWSDDAKYLISKMDSKNKKIIKYCHEIGATDSKVYKEAMFSYYLKHVLRDKIKLNQSFNSSKKTNLNGKKIYQFMWGPSEFCAVGTLKKYNKVNKLNKIKVPTLFFCGRYDEARPETTKKYSQMVKKSKFKVLAGCSHVSMQENPKLVVKTMNNFLNKIN